MITTRTVTTDISVPFASAPPILSRRLRAAAARSEAGVSGTRTGERDRHAAKRSRSTVRASPGRLSGPPIGYLGDGTVAEGPSEKGPSLSHECREVVDVGEQPR